MLRCSKTSNLSLRFQSPNAIVRTVLALLAAIFLEGCGGWVLPSDVSPDQVGVVSQDPQSWYVMYSEGTSDHPQTASNAAWMLPLPNDGHLNYVQTPYRTSARPQQIVMSYRIVASSDAVPISYDPTASPCRDHNPCTPVAEFHVFFEQQGDDLRSESGRWWYKPGFRLTDVPDNSYTAQPFVADGQPHTVTIPLSADMWTSVNGTAVDFESSLMNTGSVGITFGGSDFFGHGVQVKRGTVQFEMINFRVE